MKKLLMVFSLTAFHILTLKAQDKTERKQFPYSNRFSIQTGLLQDILLNGQNIVLAYTAQRWVFDWSHGNSLDFKSGHHFKNNEGYNMQKLDVKMPWTTGPSIGYRITTFFNVRAEFKAHRNKLMYENTNTSIVSYTTYTVGLGAFYSWYPFKKKENWLDGICIEPVVRFWPTVGSSLADNYQYENKLTGKRETIESYELGWLANINIGYTFGGK